MAVKARNLNHLFLSFLNADTKRYFHNDKNFQTYYPEGNLVDNIAEKNGVPYQFININDPSYFPPFLKYAKNIFQRCEM